MTTLNPNTLREAAEVAPGRFVEHVGATLTDPAGNVITTLPTSSTVVGATTDTPLAGETLEDATARTGISLWKRMVNKLIEIKALLAFGGATTDAAASSSVAEDATARTGIGLLKGIKNVLLLVVSALASLVSPATLTETTVTVAQTESESGEVDLAGAAIVMIYPPAAVEATTAQMSFKVGRVTGSRAQLNDEYGVKLVIPFTAAQPIRVPASMLPAVRFLSIVLETSGGVAVAQATAAREFVVVTRRV